MTLKKGFLRPTPSLPKKWKTAAYLCVSLALGVSLYFLYTLLRDIRMLIGVSYIGAPWERTDSEFLFSNLFLASMAMLSAVAVFISLVSKNLTKHFPNRRRFSILVNQSVLIIIILSFINRYALLETVFLHPTYRIAPSVNTLYTMLPLLFVLLFCVSFANSWLEILRMYKRKAYKWMLISFITVSVLSLVLSKLNMHPEEYFLDRHYGLSFLYEYNVDLPAKVYTKSNIGFPRYKRIDVVYEKVDTFKNYPKILLDDVFGRVSDIQSFYIRTCLNGSHVPHPYHRIPVIGIDKDVSMALVDSLKIELSRVCSSVSFLVNEGYSYHDDYTSQACISLNIVPWLLKSNQSENVPPLPPISSDIFLPTPEDNKINIAITRNEKYLVCGRTIRSQDLDNCIQSLLSKTSRNFISLSYPSNTRFENYINCVGHIKQARLLKLSELQQESNLWQVDTNTPLYRLRIVDFPKNKSP